MEDVKKKAKEAGEAAPEAQAKAPEVESNDSPMEHAKKEKKQSRWTLQACVKAAKRFQSREDWAARAPSSYKAALARGFVPQCVKHMQGKPAKKEAPVKAPKRLPRAG